MAWVLDRGLVKLRDQVNALAPERSRASDGSIGDTAHAERESDHNPETPPPPGNPDEQVDAIDITHDPTRGCDIGAIFEAIRESRDRRVSYMIFNRRVCSGALGAQPWVWRPYFGTNPHDKHGHMSVRDDHHDETQDWQIAMGDDMSLTASQDHALAEVWAYTVAARDAKPAPRTATHPGGPAWTVETLRRVEAKLDGLLTAVGAIGTTNPDVAAILTGVDQRLATLRAQVEDDTRDAVADLAEGGAAQVRADG